jgi:uncharacterized membrane protein (UPF0136 family)
MSPSCRRPWFPALAGGLVSLALYAVTLRAPINIYDDGFLVAGPDIRVRSPRLWGQFWTRDFFHGGIDNLYRPLASQSFGLQWWLTGDRTWPFHLVNLLLNAGVCAGIGELGRRLAGWRTGLIAALLFAVHPVHVEAVAEIVGRTELLCALGLILGLVIFLHSPLKTSRAVAISALGLMAMLSKEPGMLLPVLLFLALPVREAIYGPFTAEERQPAKWLAVLVLWSASALIVLREEILGLKFEWERFFLDWTIQPLINSHGADRWLIPIALVGRYARLLVFPTRLSIDYGAAVIYSTIPRDDPYLWIGVVCLLAGGCAAIVLWRKKKWPALFCLLAAGVTYVMASNIIIIGTIFGERLIYLPSAFLLILAAMALAKLPGKLAAAILAILLPLACVRTYTYASQWGDRDSFYAYSLQQQPKSARLHLLVAEIDRQEGRLGEARALILEGQQMLPNYWEFWIHGGMVEEDARNWALAAADYQRAFDLHPSDALENRIAHAQQMMMRAATQASTRP